MMPRSTYWQKLLNYSYAISFIFLAAITNVIANPAAVDWLQANTTPNGEISTSTDIDNPFQATSEALRTFSVLNIPPQVGTVTALQFINSESYHSTEYLVRKIIVNHLYGNDISSYVTELRGMQNWDGGYGELHAYDSSVLDTAFALDAFATINDATGSIVPGAIV